MAGSALREILAEFGFGIDTSQLESADSLVDGMGDKLLSFGKWVAAAFAVKAVVDFTKGLIDTADHLNDTAQRLNVSTDELQQWQYAAKLNGIEADELTGSLQRLQGGIADAAAGAGQAKAFKDLGVDLKNTDGTLKNTAQVFEETGLAIGALPDQTKAAGLAANIFGKSYSRLLPLFRQGPAGIAQLKKQFADLGGGLSSDFIQNAADFNDQIDTLTIAGRGLASEVLAPLLPTLVDLAKETVGFGRALAGTSKETGTLALIGRSIGNIVRTFLRGGPATSAFNAGLRTAGALARVLVEPLLDIEDFLVFLAGGDSVLGDWVDETFGPGTTKKIQAAFQEFSDGLDKTEYSVRELVGIFLAFGLTAEHVAGDVKSALLSIPLEVAAAFEQMWNQILDDASNAVQRLGRFVKELPGQGDRGADIDGAGLRLKGGKNFGAQGAVAQANADDLLRHVQEGVLAARIPQIAGGGAAPKDQAAMLAAVQAQANSLLELARATAQHSTGHGPAAPAAQAASAPGAAPWLVQIQAPTKVDVHVPPGTDADLAKRAGDGSAKGVTKANNDLSATIAAVTGG